MGKKNAFPLISVIVPVYNCEKFLSQCVESICNQSYSNLEIILVDDGSTDNSGALCEEYMLRDNRIRVIHKKNGGQQDARTCGIKMSKGEFIGFIDSDDWIDFDMYEKLFLKIGDSDLVTSGIFKYGAEGDISDEWLDLFEPGTYQLNDDYFKKNLIISEKYNNGAVIGGLTNNLVCKLFRSDIVKLIADETNAHIRTEEDFLFMLLYVLHCRKICVTHDCYYHYRYNPASITHKKSLDYLECKTRFYSVIMTALERCNADELLKLQFQRRFLCGIYSAVAEQFGIDYRVQYPKFIFPREDIIAKKKIVLFGCGKVGASYFVSWKKNNTCDIVGVMDNNPSTTLLGVNHLRNVENISNYDFDYIVCGVLDIKRADAMRRQLISLGVDTSKIIWFEPKNIWKDFFLHVNY